MKHGDFQYPCVFTRLYNLEPHSIGLVSTQNMTQPRGDQEHDAKRPKTQPKNAQKMQNMTQKMQNPAPNLCCNKFTQKFEETNESLSGGPGIA